MPVPSSITFVSTALRRFLVRQEEEAIVGSVRFGRANRKDEVEGRGRAAMRNRWRQPIDLRLPAPLPGRPVAADGKTSFHFRCTSVSKTRDLSTGAAARDGGSNSSAGGANAALNFERYVTADWAREVTPAGFERYLEEPKNERRDDHANVDGGSRAVLVKTNISEIPREREDFWTQAWGAQKTPGSQRLELFIGRGSKDDWRAIADDPEAPDALREAARRALLQTFGTAERHRTFSGIRPHRRNAH